MTELQVCRSLRESLLAYLSEQLEVSAVDQTCVLTLPIKTLDGRYVEVFVEQKIGDFVIVHDGGNAVAELFMQGIHLTDAKEKQMRALARRYGVSYEDGTFTIGLKASKVQSAVFAVAQCASLAMHDVLSHEPVIEEEPVASVVRRSLEQWRPAAVELRHRLRVRGRTDSEHVFDSVAFPKMPRLHTVAVRTLGTAYTPDLQAARYGFLGLDLQGTDFERWRRLAVIARADRWPAHALDLVRRLSTKTLEVGTGDDEQIARLLPAYMDELCEAA